MVIYALNWIKILAQNMQIAPTYVSVTLALKI